MLRHMLAVVDYPGQIWRHRYLVANFFRRELLGRFRGSMLGMVWVLIHPLFLFAIYYLVFGYLFGNVKTGVAPDPHFAIYLFSGVLAFTAIGEATSRSCSSVVDNGNLVKKVAFPSQLLPVPVGLVALLVYVVGASVCLVSGMVFDVLHPGWTLLLLPVVLLLQFAMSLGIGLFLANCHVFARDTSHLWGILVMSWMFLTPVFWFPYQLEEKFGELMPLIFAWNPAHPLIQAHRLVLGAHDFTIEPAHLVEFGDLWTHLLRAALWAVGFLVLGYGTFTSRQHKYADHV